MSAPTVACAAALGVCAARDTVSATAPRNLAGLMISPFQDGLKLIQGNKKPASNVERVG
jgi:hypothetical protein